MLLFLLYTNVFFGIFSLLLSRIQISSRLRTSSTYNYTCILKQKNIILIIFYILKRQLGDFIKSLIVGDYPYLFYDEQKACIALSVTISNYKLVQFVLILKLIYHFQRA